MMNIFLSTLWTALALYLLYNTNAVYSYLASPILSWLNPITKIKQYTKDSMEGVSYSEYMQFYHNNFVVKLLTCRYCFGIWISLFVSVLTENLAALPIIYFGSQLVCTLFNFLERKLNDE